MTSESHYLIRWKGTESGPFSTETIRHKLSTGEFGLMHEVHVDGEWITLKHFLESLKSQEQAHLETSGFPFNFHRPKKNIHDASEEEDVPDANSGVESILVIAGYFCCVAALFVYPQALGMAGFIIGTINIILRNYAHGATQIALSMLCYYIGVCYVAFVK